MGVWRILPFQRYVLPLPKEKRDLPPTFLEQSFFFLITVSNIRFVYIHIRTYIPLAGTACLQQHMPTTLPDFTGHLRHYSYLHGCHVLLRTRCRLDSYKTVPMTHHFTYFLVCLYQILIAFTATASTLLIHYLPCVTCLWTYLQFCCGFFLVSRLPHSLVGGQEEVYYTIPGPCFCYLGEKRRKERNYARCTLFPDILNFPLHLAVPFGTDLLPSVQVPGDHLPTGCLEVTIVTCLLYPDS